MKYNICSLFWVGRAFKPIHENNSGGKNRKYNLREIQNAKCVLDFGREEVLSQSRCDLVRPPPADTAQIRASAKIIITMMMTMMMTTMVMMMMMTIIMNWWLAIAWVAVQVWHHLQNRQIPNIQGSSWSWCPWWISTTIPNPNPNPNDVNEDD